MKNKFIRTVDGFSKNAKPLVSVFNKNFEDPLVGHNQRFVWDYWHVPNQYTAIRTPASHYFPQKVFSQFVRELTHWGQTHLGCMSISPPWLSYYIDGCEQKLHCDIPHGPWAYVFSLTTQHKKGFQGGETQIFKPEHLNYWKNFSSSRGMEQDDLFYRVPPKFNRLIVFDPRLPHGVTPVQGTLDPRVSRIVIHGWFTQPQPIISGSIKPKDLNILLSHTLYEMEKVLSQISPVTGTQCYQLDIGSSGKVSKIKLLTDTLMPRDGDFVSTKVLTKWTLQEISKWHFKNIRGRSSITLPLIFD